MIDITNVVIVGLGAIGSIYAMKLSDFDPKRVHILVDSKRLKRYADNGIIFNGHRHDFHYVLPEPNQVKADLILVATKSDALQSAITASSDFMHENTIILSLLNGITSEKQIAEVFGWDKVLYASFLGHGSTRVGNSITFDGVGRIVIGEANNRIISQRVEAVSPFFDRAKIAYEVPEDMLFTLWGKFVLNVGANQASAVLRANYGAFQRSEVARDDAVELMDVAVLLARQLRLNT